MTSNTLPERNNKVQSSLYQTQRKFCDYLRNPDSHPAPEGLNNRRLTVYRDLIFNNIESLLGGAFPVIKKVLNNHWPELVRKFLVDYQSSTPYFTQLANEFYRFLRQRKSRNNEPPFLLELAQHELIELELIYRHKQHSPEPSHADNTSLSETPFADLPLHLSNLAQLAHYHYPVHQISAENIPNTAPDTPTYLLAYRDDTNSVRFVQLSELAFQLLNLIDTYPGYSAGVWLESIKAHLANTQEGMSESFDDKQFFNDGLGLLQQFVDEGILYTLAVSQQTHDQAGHTPI